MGPNARTGALSSGQRGDGARPGDVGGPVENALFAPALRLPAQDLRRGAFPVHRVIMASCSEYFRVLFGVRFNIYEWPEVLVPGTSSAALAIVVEFTYKRVILVDTEEKVENVL
ncbi:hypothetical protein HPB48_021382 [Haemaphysalis longicornis]|uniref:BTB domain-containing protein n=1 Tax=Haemaphysalis longicornis TaxID=44386 RepID=A0A9J6FW34_HAELO|nr:hypothetical protein HPB48_021382 [Haemaphysalis longicornis]